MNRARMLLLAFAVAAVSAAPAAAAPRWLRRLTTGVQNLAPAQQPTQEKALQASGTADQTLETSLKLFQKFSRTKLDRMPFEDQREFGEMLAVQMVHALGSKLLPMDGDEGKAALWHYVNALPYILSRVCNRPEIRFWRVGIIESDQPTAFSTPGGYVFVTTALLRLAQDEAELAGVIAHEMVHITRRHGLYVMKQINDRFVGVGVLAAVGMARRGTGNQDFVMNILRKVTQAGAEMKYGRDTEYKADALACEWLYRMGYDPRALADFLDRLPDTKGLTGLKNHPSGQARSREIQKFVADECQGAASMARLKDRYAAMLAAAGLR